MSWEDELYRLATEGADRVVLRNKIPADELAEVERELDVIFGPQAREEQR